MLLADSWAGTLETIDNLCINAGSTPQRFKTPIKVTGSTGDEVRIYKAGDSLCFIDKGTYFISAKVVFTQPGVAPDARFNTKLILVGDTDIDALTIMSNKHPNDVRNKLFYSTFSIPSAGFYTFKIDSIQANNTVCATWMLESFNLDEIQIHRIK